MVATPTVEENLKIIEEVLSLLARYGLELNLGKCRFLQREIGYLGYRISASGIILNKSKRYKIFHGPKLLSSYGAS